MVKPSLICINDQLLFPGFGPTKLVLNNPATVLILSVSMNFLRWFSPGTPVSFTNKTDRHDITEILLKVMLNTINHNHFNFGTVLTAWSILFFILFHHFYPLYVSSD